VRALEISTVRPGSGRLIFYTLGRRRLISSRNGYFEEVWSALRFTASQPSPFFGYETAGGGEAVNAKNLIIGLRMRPGDRRQMDDAIVGRAIASAVGREGGNDLPELSEIGPDDAALRGGGAPGVNIDHVVTFFDEVLQDQKPILPLSPVTMMCLVGIRGEGGGENCPAAGKSASIGKQ